jgi:hypothetical protein
VPAFKNRTVFEMARGLKGFLNLDVGLTRGPIPNFERMLKRAQSQIKKQNRQLTETNRQFAQAREQLSERDRELDQAQERISEKGRQLELAQKRLSEKKQQLAERDRQLATLQSNIDLVKNELYDSELYFDIEKLLDRIPVDLGGGSSLSKAYLLAWLIRRYNLKQTADIGVYRGRSLFPQALAHHRFTGGVVYGVDPWSASEAKEEDIYPEDKKSKEAINRFIDQTDWQAIYQEVESMKNELHYEKNCILLRQPSANAAVYFENKDIFFDMIHVDGNHDTEKVMEDIRMYLPRLKEGGFIVLDDISFKSVQPAYNELNSKMTLIFERVDQNHANDYAVFRNNPLSPSTKFNRRLWVQDFWQSPWAVTQSMD